MPVNTLLARYERQAFYGQQAEALASVLRDLGDDPPPYGPERELATIGNERLLRGIPAVRRGWGAMIGTRPDRQLLRREGQRRRRAR
jgi:hypothetical protein